MKNRYLAKNKATRKTPQLLLLLLVVLLAAGIWFVTHTVNNTINRLYLTSLEEMAEHDKNAISQRLDIYWSDIVAAAEDVRTWYEYDDSEILKLLSADSFLIKNVHRLCLLSDDGTYYKSSGVIEYRPELVGWCKKHPGRQVARGNEFNSFSFSEDVKDIMVFISPIDPFTADGHTFSHVFCSVLVSGLEKEFMIPSFNGEGWSCIVDADGNFLVHIQKGRNLLEKGNVFDLFMKEGTDVPSGIGELQEALKKNAGYVEVQTGVRNNQGESEYSYVLFSSVPDSDWILVSVTPVSVFKLLSTKIMLIVFALLALLLIIFAAAILFIYRQRKKQQKLSSQMFDRFCADFTSVYLVDAGDNSYYVLKRTRYLNETYPQEMNFIASIDAYIETDVYPDDRVLVSASSRHEYILERLKEDDKFTIRYRDISGKDKEPRWFEMTAMRADIGNAEAYLLGFADRHEAVLEEFIREKMYGAYISVFYVDLVHDTYRVLKDLTTEDITEKRTIKKWSEAAYDIAMSCSDEETRSEIMKLTDAKQIQKELAIESRREYLHRWSTDGSRWRRIIVHAFERSHDEVTSVVIGVSRLDDFSADREDLSNQLSSALKEAEAASQAKTVFLNSMSHDIRTPMNAILGFTEIARRHIGNNEKVADSLGKVKIAGEHLLSLINDVLDMSRIESGTVVITPVEDNLLLLEQNLGPIFEALAKEKNIDFTLDMSGVKNCYVMADRLRMNQVIINVVSNAIKYTDNDGIVSLTVTETPFEEPEDSGADADPMLEDSGSSASDKLEDSGSSASDKLEDSGSPADQNVRADKTEDASRIPARANYVFTVRDNGIGMSPEFQKHLFETFSREETALVSKREGTGLGLSITKRLVDMMGGTIVVESARREGSTFIITIPLDIVAEPKKKSEAVRISTQQKTLSASSEEPAESELKDRGASAANQLEDRGAGAEPVLKDRGASEEPAAPGLKDRATSAVHEKKDKVARIAHPADDSWQDDRVAGADFELDAKAISAVMNKREPSSSADSTLKNKRVLLVDDNDFNREIALENLGDEGMIIEEAVNGADALKKVKLAGPNYFDVVLMDVQMPVMDGYEATKAIRELGVEYGQIPIIAVSANAFEEDIRRSEECGMSAHLSKPIRIPELIETLNKLL